MSTFCTFCTAHPAHFAHLGKFCTPGSPFVHILHVSQMVGHAITFDSADSIYVVLGILHTSLFALFCTEMLPASPPRKLSQLTTKTGKFVTITTLAFDADFKDVRVI